MCGGIVASAGRIPKKDLKKFYSAEQVKEIEKSGELSSFFWNSKPALPVEEGQEVHLLPWGNRDKNIKLPQTGWARKETLDQGHWDYLKPKRVHIPISKGYEKKVWFSFKSGTEGIVVEKSGDKRVYMITEPADEEYLQKTMHDRMAPGEKSDFVLPSNKINDNRND